MHGLLQHCSSRLILGILGQHVTTVINFLNVEPWRGTYICVQCESVLHSLTTLPRSATLQGDAALCLVLMSACRLSYRANIKNQKLCWSRPSKPSTDVSGSIILDSRTAMHAWQRSGFIAETQDKHINYTLILMRGNWALVSSEMPLINHWNIRWGFLYIHNLLIERVVDLQDSYFATQLPWHAAQHRLFFPSITKETQVGHHCWFSMHLSALAANLRVFESVNMHSKFNYWPWELFRMQLTAHNDEGSRYNI